MGNEIDVDELIATAAAVEGYYSGAGSSASADPNHGWQTVSYPKRHRKPAPPPTAPAAADPFDRRPNGVFDEIEKIGAERRRKLEAAPAAAYDDDAELDDEIEGNETAEESKESKPKRPKKPKQPKITVADAASAIDADHLASHLAEISESYESQQNIQLMRFADYFGRAFAAVSAAQFPWAKLFKESSLAKIVDIPICYVPEPVCQTAANWISQRSSDALGEFVLWCLDTLVAELAVLKPAPKGSKRPVQQPSSSAQVAMFVALSIVLRRKPDILINIMPTLIANYQGQEKLTLIMWVVGQASQTDLVVGMHCWAYHLFPSICGKSGGNPQSRDLVLQLAERMLANPKARTILVNNAVWKGGRLVPASTFDLLTRVAFPAPASRIKATERFEALYPTLKEIALAGPPASKTVKHVAQQLFPICMLYVHESIPKLTVEALDVSVWCLTQSSECYKQWENLYLENVVASLLLLRIISDDWKLLHDKLIADPLKETIKKLRTKNEAAIADTADAERKAQLKEADKRCKLILGKLSRHSSFVKGGVVAVLIAIAVGVALSSSAPDFLEWNKLHAIVTSHLSA